MPREHLGNLIREARHAHGLSSTALAKAIGIDQSNLVRLERGQVAKPHPAVLDRLSSHLGLPLTDLYQLADVPVPELELHPYLRAGYGLDDQDIAKVHAYIQRLASQYGADGSGPSEGADE